MKKKIFTLLLINSCILFSCGSNESSDVYLKDILTYINDFELDDIQSISTCEGTGAFTGTESDVIEAYRISTNKSDIKKFYNWLNESKVEIEELPTGNLGGVGKPYAFEVILKDGTVYKEALWAACIIYGDENKYYCTKTDMPLVSGDEYLAFSPIEISRFYYDDNDVYDFLTLLHLNKIDEVSDENIIYDDVKFICNKDEVIVLNDKQFYHYMFYYEIINDYSFDEYLDSLK